MRYRHLLATTALLTTLAGLAHGADAASDKAWQQGIQRTDLARHDLYIPDQEVIQARVDFAPGGASPRHSHPGVEVAYVISGTFEYQLQGQAPVRLKAGQSLYIPAGTPHVATNIGDTPASELATYIVDKRQPVLKLEH